MFDLHLNGKQLLPLMMVKSIFSRVINSSHIHHNVTCVNDSRITCSMSKKGEQQYNTSPDVFILIALANIGLVIT